MTTRSKMILLKANLDIASGYVCSDHIQRDALREAKRMIAELLEEAVSEHRALTNG